MAIIYKRLGKTKEKIPALGMGTWQMSVDGGSLAALKKGLALGDGFIDTAEIYGTEELVGSAIKDEGEDENDVFIASKVWPSHFKYKEVLHACEQSLKRLGVKTIDLYQLHWPNYTVPIEETMAAMEHLQKEGKIRHIGVSNFTVKEFQEAQACLSHSDIVSNQVEYSIIMREPEKDGLLEFCEKEGVTLIAYSPLASGALFERRRAPLLKELEAIAARYGKTASQISLSWLISHEPVVAIPKASTVTHTEQNIATMDIGLLAEDIAELDEVSSRFRKLHHTPLAGSPLTRKILKHTKFWHKYAERKYGGNKNL